MSGISDGAKAGSAFGPWGTAIGAGIGATTDMVKAAEGGPFTGGSSMAATYGTSMDDSGWVVNFGGQQQMAAPTVSTPRVSRQLGVYEYGSASSVEAATGVPAWALVAVVLLFVAMKKG